MSTQFQNITDLIERLEDAAMFITYQGATPEKEAALNAARQALLDGIFAQPQGEVAVPDVPDTVSEAQAAVARNLEIYHRVADRRRAATTHPDDAAIDCFAGEALKPKMAEGRAKGRSGWETCPPEVLSRMLHEHVEKGDPRDVALFCMMLWSMGARIAAAPQPKGVVSSKRVYLVATGETCNGLETYTRHEAQVPMADQEVLWAAEPMAQLFANFAAADLPTWSRTMLEQFVGRAHEELVKLFAWTSELYENPLTDDTMRAIRTRALDEYGTGQAQGELWDQILMRETARTIQAAAKGGV